MEDVKELLQAPKNITHQLGVSILVLMEDVKEQHVRISVKIRFG